MLPALEIEEQDVYARTLTRFRAWLYEDELDDDGNPIPLVLASDDVVAFVFAERIANSDEPGTAVFTVRSDDETAFESTIEIEDLGEAHDPPEETDHPAQCLITIRPDETDAVVDGWEETVKNRRYIGQVFVLDHSEGDEPLLAGRGRFLLHRSY